jgi:chromosome segregation ATPase
MNTLVKVAVLLLVFASQTLHAEARKPSENNSAAMMKLQATIKTLTDESEAAKAEIAKLTTENEQGKSKIKQLDVDMQQAIATNQRAVAEVTSQRESNAQLRSQLEATNNKLQEAVKANQDVNQAKADLSNEYSTLQGKQHDTDQQLKLCGEHNVKLLGASKELLDRYQNKGTWSAMFQEEPALQFTSVEMQNIVQDYQDKLNAGKYQKPATTEACDANTQKC